MDKLIKQMEELIKTLNKYSYQYYVLDDSQITDAKWDLMYDDLIALEKQTGVVLQDSPTLRIGGEVLSGFSSHTHLAKLWSLDKSNSVEDIINWRNRVVKQLNQDFHMDESKIDFILEYKYDGLTINLTYDKGFLVGATTRGNGEVGEEILSQVRTINTIPLSIPFKGKMEVQAEGVMNLSVLKKLNSESTEQLKNARNAAAGALRNMDISVTAKRKLQAYCYNIGYIEGASFETATKMLDFLRDNNFPVGKCYTDVTTIENIESIIDNIQNIRDDLDFLIDGVVIKINSYKLRNAIGYTIKFPKWALAYKFEAIKAVTTVLDVVWNVGRTGKITPIANLSPIDIDGATIQNATLNNFSYIQKKDVKIGSEVAIRRSNDVIPEIMYTVTSGDTPITQPTQCPDCGSNVVEVGANIFCFNSSNCTSQIVAGLTHYASRDAMDIESFSEKTAEIFVKKLGVKNVYDLYSITKEDLMALDGFQDKKADNFINNLNSHKNPTLSAFIYSLGIPNVGKKTAKDLANKFKTLQNIKDASFDELNDMQDIGFIVANCIVEYFTTYGKDIVDKLTSIGVIPIESVQTNTPITNKMIAITGTHTRPRSEIAKVIEANGGFVQSTVNKKTDLLILGKNAGSKEKKAIELGILIMSEQEFFETFKL